MGTLEGIAVGIGGAVLALLTLGLFATGFDENNGTYSIAGAIIVASVIIARAIARRG